MPRKSSGRPAPRPSVRSSAPKKNASPPPAKSNHGPPPAPVQPSSGGSMLGNIGGVIAEGMAFGTGSAIAHRAVDAVMGPRVVQHEHATVNAEASVPMASPVSSSMPDACTGQAKAFQECITSNGSDIGRCQFYLDMLKECQRGPAGNGVQL